MLIKHDMGWFFVFSIIFLERTKVLMTLSFYSVSKNMCSASDDIFKYFTLGSMVKIDPHMQLFIKIFFSKMK